MSENRPAPHVVIDSFEDMTLREQALHLSSAHGFDVDYFEGHGFEGLVGGEKYDLTSKSEVLRYFRECEGARGMYEWHWNDHDDDTPYGGGRVLHRHLSGDPSVPNDVLESIRDAFARSRN